MSNYPPQWTPPGPPPGPGYGGGYGPPPPKSRKPLIIGLVAGGGVLVVVLALVLVALFVLGGGPTLSTAQFERLFAQGDTYQGSTIIRRVDNQSRSDDPGPTNCSAAIVKSFQKAKDWMVATSSDPDHGLIAARFESIGEAREAREKINACGSGVRGYGTEDGANWLLVEVDGNQLVVVQMGNVLVVAATESTENQIAAEVAKEYRESAK